MDMIHRFAYQLPQKSKCQAKNFNTVARDYGKLRISQFCFDGYDYPSDCIITESSVASIVPGRQATSIYDGIKIQP
jgi:hypothetical protein